MTADSRPPAWRPRLAVGSAINIRHVNHCATIVPEPVQSNREYPCSPTCTGTQQTVIRGPRHPGIVTFRGGLQTLEDYIVEAEHSTVSIYAMLLYDMTRSLHMCCGQTESFSSVDQHLPKMTVHFVHIVANTCAYIL